MNSVLDINECRDSSEPACVMGECINLQGSFRCTCPEDSVLDSDGRTCREIRKELCYKTVLWNGRCTDPSSEVCYVMTDGLIYFMKKAVIMSSLVLFSTIVKDFI